MLFSRYSNNLPLIETKVKNSLYIVSKITKEVDSISFIISIRQVKPIAESDKIAAFVAVLSSTISIQSA